MILVISALGFECYKLPRQGTVILGSGQGADVRLDEPLAAPRHAEIDVGAALRLTLRAATCPARINGHPLPLGKQVPVAMGDRVEIGSALVIPQPGARWPAAPRAAQRRLTGEVQPENEPIVNAPVMRALFDTIERVADSNISVLLLGETGVGKEVVAEALHRRSSRAGGPFVRLNCAAFAETLLESELFGHERGAFTGAHSSKPGLLEAASGGTVFLDELGEMRLRTQAKLLRVLEERVVTRVGGLRERPVDIRIISATNRDLSAEVASGRFREDLYYRLAAMPLRVPPLRERTSDIEPLASNFAARAAHAAGLCATPPFSAGALQWLRRQRWPGNVRELRNAVERAVLLAESHEIQPEHLVSPESPRVRSNIADDGASPFTAFSPLLGERERIVAALDRTGGNQTEAAKLLGICRRTLLYRLDEYDIPRPRKRPRMSTS